MATLEDKGAAALVKFMLVGHSGSGKTGALGSLVKAGYRLKIIDLDQNIGILRNVIKQTCPDKLGMVDFLSFRDKYKTGPTGPVVAGAPKAYVNTVNALDKWDDGSVPSEWGSDTILVLDSLTALGRAAFAWAKQMNPGAREPRQWYFTAQESIEAVIATLTGDSFGANVIVISHIDIREQADKSIAGFPSAIGAALGPKLPRYFNTLVVMDTIGTGNNVKRRIKTVPTALLTSVKTENPWAIAPEYPIETGLADLFEKLR